MREGKAGSKSGVGRSGESLMKGRGRHRHCRTPSFPFATAFIVASAHAIPFVLHYVM